MQAIFRHLLWNHASVILGIRFKGNARVSATLQAEACEPGHPDIAVPRKVVFLDALMLLGVGKIDNVPLKRLTGAAQ